MPSDEDGGPRVIGDLRRGATRVADVTLEVRAKLDAGLIETRSLVECYAVDFAALAAAVAPDLPVAARERLTTLAAAGVTRRMVATAEVLLEQRGADVIDALMRHPSDLVRGWSAYMIAAEPGRSLAERLQRLQPLADDDHFGVREWAWLAVRPHICVDVAGAIVVLSGWCADPSERIRRFAAESTRPRGVWAAHIASLKQRPEMGLAVLEPLRADPARYVQDSVGNWLNDAAKDRRSWVETVCARWLAESPVPPTAAIVRRALRGRPAGPVG